MPWLDRYGTFVFANESDGQTIDSTIKLSIASQSTSGESVSYHISLSICSTVSIPVSERFILSSQSFLRGYGDANAWISTVSTICHSNTP
jgi:hypothetical protein